MNPWDREDEERFERQETGASALAFLVLLGCLLLSVMAAAREELAAADLKDLEHTVAMSNRDIAQSLRR